MSWQDYVDNQLLASQCVSRAAIAGHDGGIWAKSEGFDVSTHIFFLFSLKLKLWNIRIKKKKLVSVWTPLGSLIKKWKKKVIFS